MITWLVAQLGPLGLPERLRKPLAWVAVSIVAALLLWGAYEAWKASVIEDHETERLTDAIKAYDGSAEQRAADTITNIIANKDRSEAIETAAASEAAKPVEQRAKLPPTTLAANCVRLRQAYTARELAKMSAFQEHCR